MRAKMRGLSGYLFSVMQALVVILQDRDTGSLLSCIFILIDNIAGEVFLPEGKTTGDAWKVGQ